MKANQKTLYNDLKLKLQENLFLNHYPSNSQSTNSNQTAVKTNQTAVKIEKNRGRLETRVCTILPYQNENWTSIKTIIMIQKHIQLNQTKPQANCKNMEVFETIYLISNEEKNADYYLNLKRKHWSIEAFHYIKNITYKEDTSKITKLNSPKNHSFIKSLAITIYKSLGFNNQASAIRLLSNNIPALFKILMRFGS